MYLLWGANAASLQLTLRSMYTTPVSLNIKYNQRCEHGCAESTSAIHLAIDRARHATISRFVCASRFSCVVPLACPYSLSVEDHSGMFSAFKMVLMPNALGALLPDELVHAVLWWLDDSKCETWERTFKHGLMLCTWPVTTGPSSLDPSSLNISLSRVQTTYPSWPHFSAPMTSWVVPSENA